MKTAWRTSALGDAVGQYIRLQLAAPITTDHMNLVQPITSSRNRWITKVDLRFDGGAPHRVTLDTSSRSAGGQTISFGRRRFSTLEIKIAAVSDPRRKLFSGADGVGLAEIRLRDVHSKHDVRVDEVEQMPQDLLNALGTDAATHPLVVLMSRDAVRGVPPRTDPEPALERTFTLPGPRAFALTGSASVNPAAGEAAIDAALGVGPGVTATASASLAACLECRAASAADSDPATAWNTPFVNVDDQWVQFEARRPITFSHMNLQVVADGRHSVPTSIELSVDGAVRDLTVPPIADGSRENATTTVPLRFPAMTGRRIRVTIKGTRVLMATRESTGDKVMAPVAIAELGIPGLRVKTGPAAIPNRCRSDLLSIDGEAFPVRVSGAASAAGNLSSLAVTPCDPAHPARVPTVKLDPGDHVVRTSEGVRTGLQLDRVVLASAEGGTPLAVAAGRVTGLGAEPLPAPKITVTSNGETRMRVHVSGADAPFWLVLGQSQSAGWKANVVGGGSLGPSQLVDGYANGWFVKPDDRAFDVVLEWTPQNQVWTAIWISVLASLLCLGLIAWAIVRRRRGAAALGEASDSDVEVEWPSRPRGTVETTRRGRIVVPILAGLVASLVVAPWAGLLAAVAVVLVQWRPSLRAIVAVTPAALLAIVLVYMVYLQHHFRFPPVFEWPTLFPLGRPLGWLAVVFLGVDVLVERTRAYAPLPPNVTGAPEHLRDNHLCSRCVISQWKWVAGTR